jgi:hypothetical protein
VVDGVAADMRNPHPGDNLTCLDIVVVDGRLGEELRRGDVNGVVRIVEPEGGLPRLVVKRRARESGPRIDDTVGVKIGS